MRTRVAMLRSKSLGGVEPRLAKEARALAGAGYDVHLVLWDRDLSFPPEEVRDSYRIHRVRYPAPYNHPSLAWKLPRWWSRAYRVLRTLQPAIVHAADYDTVPPALKAHRDLGSKFVFDIWDFYADMILARVPRFVRRALRRREAQAIELADLVILPDMIGRQRIMREPRKLIEVMNVPEEGPVVPRRAEGFTVFYAGNIARDRGILELLPATEAMGARLLVAGKGPGESEILPPIQASPRARYLGQLPHEEVVRYAAGADVIPLLYDPSIPINRIASPNKLYEAMMLSKPVIVSDGTSMAELVREEDIGLVVRYGDPVALRAALDRLAGSPELRERLGSRARRLYEGRYRWTQMRDRLVRAYDILATTTSEEGAS